MLILVGTTLRSRRMKKKRTSAVVNQFGFRLGCREGEAGRLRVDAESVWVTVGQYIRRHGSSEMWESVAVEGKREQDGTLVVRVMVFNPDWDEPLQIASIRSHPGDPACLTPLDCNLDQGAI